MLRLVDLQIRAIYAKTTKRKKILDVKRAYG